MIKIHNQAACEQAMNAAWNEERAEIGDQCPVEVQIMFSRGFRYCRMDYEKLEAENRKLRSVMISVGASLACELHTDDITPEQDKRIYILIQKLKGGA